MRLRILLVVGVSLTGSLLIAARPMCSKTYSIWCHTYVWGYTQCAMVDEKGDYIREVAPGDVSAWCGAIP